MIPEPATQTEARASDGLLYRVLVWIAVGLLGFASTLAHQMMERLDAVRLEVAAQRRDLEHHERLLERLEVKLDAQSAPVRQAIQLSQSTPQHAHP